MKYLAAVLAILIFVPSAMAAHNVTFGWNANTDEDLAYYKLYRGTQSGGPYTHICDIQKPGVECTENGIPDGIYYWTLTAVDDAGNESGYSDEVSDTLVTPDVTPPEIPTGLHIINKVIQGN